MKTVKVPDLSGPALDWVVAKCEGYLPSYTDPAKAVSPLYRDGEHVQLRALPYSFDWSLAGPIIEREKMALWFDGESNDYAASGPLLMNTPTESQAFYGIPLPTHGPTPLIAAMRCYVASRLGDTVEIPEELV